MGDAVDKMAVKTATQGDAVKRAIEGEPRGDVDRWDEALGAEVGAGAGDAAAPAGAEKPLGGLARDGGVVEGEGS